MGIVRILLVAIAVCLIFGEPAEAKRRKGLPGGRVGGGTRLQPAFICQVDLCSA